MNNELNNEESKNNEKTNEENDSVKDGPINEEEYLVKMGQLENEISDLKDKLLRKAAEFENYKRRVENEQSNLVKYSAESFIIKLLPIVDDFERSLKHIEDSNEPDSIKKGIELVYNKLTKLLDEQGVKKIDSVGKPFNVDYHDALMQKKVENVKPHTVVEEIEAGYIYKDRVIRHAKVIVSEEQTEDVTAREKSNNNPEE